MSKYLDRFKKESLVAALGFNDGANKGFWRVQWRDRLGRFAEMGRGVLSKVRMPNGEVMDMRGVFIGGSNRPGFGRVLVKGQSEKGISDGVYEIGSNNGEIFQAKLTDETLERAGVEDIDTTTASERLDSDIPNLADVVRNDITPADEKLATDSPDDAQKAIIEEERAKSPIAKLPAGSEGRDPESAKKILEDAGVDLADKAGVAPAEKEAKALTPAKEGDFRPTSDPKDRSAGYVFKKGRWTKASFDDRDKNWNQPKGQDTGTSEIVDARKLEEGMTVKNPDGSTKTISKITKETSKQASEKAGKAASSQGYTTVEYDDGSTDSWSTVNGQLGFDAEKPYFEVVGPKDAANTSRPEIPGLLIPGPGKGNPPPVIRPDAQFRPDQGRPAPAEKEAKAPKAPKAKKIVTASRNWMENAEAGTEFFYKKPGSDKLIQAHIRDDGYAYAGPYIEFEQDEEGVGIGAPEELFDWSDSGRGPSEFYKGRIPLKDGGPFNIEAPELRNMLADQRAKSPIAAPAAKPAPEPTREQSKADLSSKISGVEKYMPPQRQYGGTWDGGVGQVYENGAWRAATLEEAEANGFKGGFSFPPKTKDPIDYVVSRAFDDAAAEVPVNLDDLITHASKGKPAAEDGSDEVLPGSPEIKAKKAPEDTKVTFPDELKAGDVIVQEKDGVRSEATVLEAGMAPVGADGLKRYFAVLKTKDGIKKFTLRGTDKLNVDKNKKDKASVEEYGGGTASKPKTTETATPAGEKKTPKGVAPKRASAKKVEDLPRTVATTDTPIEKARASGRVDNGQMIERTSKTDQELFDTKVEPLVDENGDPVEFYDVETGEVAVAGNADAIEEQILKDYPDAVINEDGQIVVERRGLPNDPATGAPRELEMFIERTQGNAFYIGAKVTNVDTGKSDTYYHYDLRDSYSSIHGKANGIQRLSRVISGEEIPLQEGSPDYNQYFAPGRDIQEHIAYFRGKYSSKLTEEKLIKALRMAKGRGVPADIKKANRDLQLFRTSFGGDEAKFREYDTIQKMRMLTLEEMTKRYADGRGATANSSPDQLGRIMKSQVDGAFDTMIDGDLSGSVLRLQELAGRLPMFIRNQKVAQTMLDTLREGFNTRMPSENKLAVSAMVTNAFKMLQSSQTLEAHAAAPHMSWDGVVLKKGHLVEYFSNDGKSSVGMVTGLRPLARNKYDDKVFVRFKNSDGSYTPPIELVAAKMITLDTSGDSPEARERISKYTPDIGGLELVEKRMGKRGLKTKLALLNSRKSNPNVFDGSNGNPDLDEPNLGTDGEEGGGGDSDLPAGHKAVENMAPGDIMYSKDGEVLGQIVSIREVKSKSGKSAFAVLYMDKNGDVKKPEVLQVGETRGPKA